MSEVEEVENEDEEQVSKYAWPLFWVALAAIVAVFSTGIFLTDQYKNLGPWGDFVGGTLNPILTFITFIAVLITLALQRTELRLTRKEMKRSSDALISQGKTQKDQAFENTFFELLRMQNTIVESIDLVNSETGVVFRGRDAFDLFYTRLTKKYRGQHEKWSGQHPERYILDVAYFVFWKDAQNELSHYFRFLYNFCRFLDESDVNDELYARLLRSQISNQELLLLYYNNLSTYGSSFRQYATKFKLFDNLPVVRLLDRSHAEFCDEAAFGDNPMDWTPHIPKPS